MAMAGVSAQAAPKYSNKISMPQILETINNIPENLAVHIQITISQ